MKNFKHSMEEWININYIIRVFQDIEIKDTKWSTAIVIKEIGWIYSDEPVEQIVKKIKEAQQ